MILRSGLTFILKRISCVILILLFLQFQGQSQDLASAGSQATGVVPDYTLFIFTGSDWCMNCKRLEKKVLSDPAFTESMKNNGIEIRIVDFPQRKKLDPETLKYNQSIADKYHFEGVYPSFVLTKKEAKQYKQFYYRNQGGDEFSGFILETKAKLDE